MAAAMTTRTRTVSGAALICALTLFAIEASSQGPAGKVPPQLPPQAADKAKATVQAQTAPTVSLTAPAVGALYTAPAAVLLGASAAASSSGRSISQVEFFAGPTLIGAATTAPYSFNWNNVAAGSYSLTARATDNLGVASISAPVAIIVNAPPTVSLESPGNNALFTAPAAITLAASAADADGSIAQVEFFQGTSLVATVTSAPYSFSLANVAAGSYVFSARATDDRGAVATSTPVTVRVNAPPSVSVTSPDANSIFTSLATIPLIAEATDADGTVARVEFYSGASLIAGVTVAPYSFSWTDVPAGNYSITARATDDLGAVTSSGTVTLTVNAPPTVSLTSPAGNSTFTAPATIPISAQVADTDGTIARVEFYNGGNLIGALTTPPFDINWLLVPAGSYNLTARATDNLGATTGSAMIAVTVNQAVAQIYYIHTDHLNTPRAIYDQSQQLVWQWDNTDPFGGNLPNENPSGLGNFTCNLRLPGQYFDRETNLHYNYFRDYDPGIGRYVQSDPIGLKGGVSTYAYGLNNPINNFDWNGLDATVTYFPGFPGHIGIAINSSDTVGLYPQQRGPRVAFCGTVAGVVALDRQRQDPKYVAQSQSVTIRSAPWQDQLMQERINIIQRNAPTYNLCVDQCTAFVATVLRAGGVFIYSSTEELTPLGLIQQLQSLYDK